MTLLEIFVVALALAADAFTVGVAVGLTHRSRRQIFRLSFHFGLFQALLPLFGALAGYLLGGWILSWKHWLAAGLLFAIGGKMAAESLSKNSEESSKDPTRGLSMVGLSVAVSIDALAVGFSLGLEDVSIPLAVTVIGVVTAGLTWVGMLLAGAMASRVGKRAGLVAGIVLVGLGVKLIVEHYMG